MNKSTRCVVQREYNETLEECGVTTEHHRVHCFLILYSTVIKILYNIYDIKLERRREQA